MDAMILFFVIAIINKQEGYKHPYLGAVAEAIVLVFAWSLIEPILKTT